MSLLSTHPTLLCAGNTGTHQPGTSTRKKIEPPSYRTSISSMLNELLTSKMEPLNGRECLTSPSSCMRNMSMARRELLDRDPRRTEEDQSSKSEKSESNCRIGAGIQEAKQVKFSCSEKKLRNHRTPALSKVFQCNVHALSKRRTNQSTDILSPFIGM